MNRKAGSKTSARLLLTGMLWASAAGALSTDREQPIYIEADHADINDKTGISVYTGRVEVTQGSMRLDSDKLTVHMKNDELEKAIAVGKPAHYRQRPDGKDKDVEAEALRMEYYATKDRIILIEQAKAWQGGDTFESERITYDIARDLVTAGAKDGKDRVRIVIQPRKKEGGTAQ